jgi:hypothetical protein
MKLRAGRCADIGGLESNGRPIKKQSESGFPPLFAVLFGAISGFLPQVP